MTRLVRHKFSGKIMEVVRETDTHVIYGKPGDTLRDRFVMGSELFYEKWEPYKGDPLAQPDPVAVSAPVERSNEKPEKRKRGRPKGSKNKPKGESVGSN